jgi:hypothetical protein
MMDAQREMEQRALRNVRGLVDKVETLDDVQKSSERRMLKRLAIGAVVVIAAFAGYLAYVSSQSAKPVVIDAKKLPPLQGGPQR